VVRVNDRGPVVEGRIIDLSYNAARVLGFKDRGLQQVRVDLVHAQTYAQLRPLAN
jgi:rare lipoprotein A